jgi:hypothetical protein
VDFDTATDETQPQQHHEEGCQSLEQIEAAIADETAGELIGRIGG